MKRIFNLILCLGLVGSLAYAQTPDPAQPNASSQEAPAFDALEPGSDAYRELATQRGDVVLHNDKLVSDLKVAYTLYPQPASKYLAIDLATEQPTQPSVYLTTTEGARVDLRAEAPVRAMLHRLEMNMKNLPEGIYYLHIVVPGVGTSEGMPIIKMDAAPVLIQ